MFVHPTTAVEIPVVLKNTPEVVVSVYEVSTMALYQKANPDTFDASSVDVRGLVPNVSRRLSFDHSPLVRHQELLTFSEMGEGGSPRYVLGSCARAQSVPVCLRARAKALVA